jgi:hypothetical protein
MANLSVTHHSSRPDPNLTPAPLARVPNANAVAVPPVLQVTPTPHTHHYDEPGAQSGGREGWQVSTPEAKPISNAYS